MYGRWQGPWPLCYQSVCLLLGCKHRSQSFCYLSITQYLLSTVPLFISSLLPYLPWPPSVSSKFILPGPSGVTFWTPYRCTYRPPSHTVPPTYRLHDTVLTRTFLITPPVTLTSSYSYLFTLSFTSVSAVSVPQQSNVSETRKGLHPFGDLRKLISLLY